jgi:ABC-2 type transport system permease protein
MLRRTLAIARAEWIHNKRDPRSLFVILALPVVLLLLYGYGINYDVQHVRFAVMDLDGGETARELLDQFRRSRYFSFCEAITDQRRIQELLDASKVAFVMVIPPDLGRALGAGREGKVQIILDGSDTTQANVAVGYIEAAVMDYSAGLAVDFAQRQGVAATLPLDVRPIILYNADLKSVRFIVPGLIAILLMMLAALLTSTCLVREREWGSFEALVTSPARPHEILIGKMIPYVCIAFADVILCIGAGRLIFDVYPTGSVAFLLAVSALYLLASLSIGLLFSVMAKTQQVAILFAMLATLLPTILLSGFAFPRASMPVVLRWLSNIIPATHFLTVIRSIYLKAAGPGLLWPQIAILTVFTVALMALAARRFRKRL